jgi:hypothetical protein
MDLICPRCGSKSNELMECDNCGAIGCIRCMRKSYGKWICHRCETPRYYLEPEKEEEKKISDAFTSMFG